MADAVKEFLKGSGAPKSKVEFNAEQSEVVKKFANLQEQEKNPIEEAPEAIIVPVDPIFSPENPMTGRQKYKFIRDVDVEVTTGDKDLYCKATLCGKPIELTIEMQNKFKVVLRTLSNYEADLTYFALEHGLREGFIQSQAVHASYHQQYCLTMQLVSVMDKPVDHLTFVKRASNTVQEDVEKIIESSVNILNMPQTYFGLLVRCANIFNHKLKKLEEMALNGDFWMPRDTD